MAAHRFTDTVISETRLRELMGEPSELVVRKGLNALGHHCRAFIALSPLALVGTVSANGAADVSPRGDAPGFVQALDDHTLVIPERPGNRRLDTLRNILQTGRVGLLFIVPGVEETLRVNGRAYLVRDAEILDRATVHGKRPLIAIGVKVEECFMHCAKAFKRSKLWDSTLWPDRAMLPSLARMLLDQARLPGATIEGLDARLEESYVTRLY